MTQEVNALSSGKQYRIVRDARERQSRPLISVLVAVYEVEQYLPATLKSFAAQKNLQADSVEYIFVSDKSPDRSLQIIDEWVQHRTNAVVIEANTNGGPAHARNIGMEVARGEWVTSVDPDDVISESYFAEVLRMWRAAGDEELALISTRVYITEDETGRFKDTHPLGRKFRYGNRFVHLERHPECIQLGATVFLRKSVIDEFELSYDTRCVPTFEDGGLIGKYLAHFNDPVIGLAASSHYFYRKRSSNDSAVQKSFTLPERYTSALRYGYLAMLQAIRATRGYIPRWASNMVLYDLAWYFKQDDSMKSLASWIEGTLRQEFLGLLRSILKLIPADHIEEFFVNPMSWSMRQALLLWSGSVATNARVFVWRNDASTADFSVLTGPGLTDLEMLVNAEPVAEGDIVGRHRYSFFKEFFMEEITVRTNAGDIAVFVDGLPVRPVPVVKPRWPEKVMDESLAEMTAAARRQEPSSADKRRERMYVRALIRGVNFGSVIAESGLAAIRRRLAKSRSDIGGFDDAREVNARELLSDPVFVSKWRGCWVLIDHIDRADDNAEHLLRYMMREHPDTRAVYLLTRKSSDWNRLEREGFPLVEYGSALAWAVATLADVVVSSDAIEGCMYPAPRARFGTPAHKFVFLQHGVSCNDISRWLNGKRIHLLTAATRAEYDAFTKDDSPYSLTTDEVSLTGLARYDSLYRLRMARDGNNEAPSKEPVILVMPTWRQYLKDIVDGAGSSREMLHTVFGTPFGLAWLELMQSERLARMARERGVRIRFLLHPNMVALVDSLNFDPVIEVVPTSDSRFQIELSGASAFITDYSSLMFDAAYVGMPIAYYQFEEPALKSGVHSWRPGYFDYANMGFGPVCSQAQEVIDWVDSAIADGFTIPRLYRERVSATFAYWDNRNCERCYERIVTLLS
ncbi:bifunctional glycosyltransferase/CDP-glycerol:glycerophosphate glycerophosphotransferase [Actinomyces ruminicola]|uniref:CDP-glycerol glycerophosphotransferase, TagB/SpsB family n=1 Tax=Actinomyces ruminicola TaxID=332524 RepID=A0A1G9YAW1_9ACTO|nr:CDP-glycerol glycerophosphotransferase family protein [Actinomyces ruminicola]SDN06208.1 CDP-glycerol glycerophosphotransferase, TagB/SpsB family [Actinomyces ruminicola]